MLASNGGAPAAVSVGRISSLYDFATPRKLNPRVFAAARFLSFWRGRDREIVVGGGWRNWDVKTLGLRSGGSGVG